MSDPNVYDVGQVVTLKALFLVGSTLGTIVAGQSSLLVQDASGLAAGGAPVFVAGAGAIGGDLTTTVSAIAGQAVTLAQAAGSTVNRVLVGQPQNASGVTCKLQLPDGSEQTLATSNPAAGSYRASFTVTLAGDHFYRFSGTGAAAGDAWNQFYVRPERVP